ncbi:peptide-N-glycosidase F-related protein [Taibaiella soli]|uniref:Peptide-N-glycosidase F N-terminal domain-containing protein n=1 Tax=Taibaiella soli TaxID=1649169 RepID=A0A2W2AKT1_9BACT|nr:peptide-N-glycosidase F-related protein [Taibaiella soli]PZF74172.1 hypothetical protein DN068_03920 [Taibaiella soli]
MNKTLLTLFVAILSSFGFAAKASQDTTVVTSHQDVVIKTNPAVGHTLYPQWAEFPNTNVSYRRVMMMLEFECAPGLMCGEWDYINNVYIGHLGGVNGDSLGYEIARFITPYGKGRYASSNWSHTWYYDVTDFAPLLHDSVEVIYQHTGYEGNTDRGWKINVKFICVEGTPVREPIAVHKLWSGSFPMGNINNPVESHLIPVQQTLNSQTNNVRIRMMNTGHGADSAENCMEFCAKYREIMWDNNMVSHKSIWRNDCGSNALYPQAGTWIYDRGGWCPGSPVRYDDVDILNVAGSSQHTVDMNMEPYTAYKSFGNINTTGFLIEYKPIASTNDATLENVIAPSPESEFLRYNPICNQPIIVIRNSGSTDLTSLNIHYGVEGGPTSLFQWTGNLKFMQTDTVTLTTPVNWTASSGNFVIYTSEPNNATDQYNADDTARTTFATPRIMPKSFVVSLRTDGAASEKYYRIIDMNNGNIVFDKNNLTDNTTYNDTINLAANACYKFYFGCDGPSNWGGQNKSGLNFWAYTQYIGSGSLSFKNLGSTLPINGLSLSGSATAFAATSADFGAFYSFNFTTESTLSVSQVNKAEFGLEVYPNPTSDLINVIYSSNEEKSRIELFDMQGRRLDYQTATQKAGVAEFNLAAYPTGIYFIKYLAGEDVIVRKVIKQ